MYIRANLRAFDKSLAKRTRMSSQLNKSFTCRHDGSSSATSTTRREFFDLYTTHVLSPFRASRLRFTLALDARTDALFLSFLFVPSRLDLASGRYPGVYGWISVLRHLFQREPRL